MALSLLDTNALEIIVNCISSEDKSSLFRTGCGALMSKLTQLQTDISILPVVDIYEYCKEGDEGAISDPDIKMIERINSRYVGISRVAVQPIFYRKIGKKTCSNMDDTVYYRQFYSEPEPLSCDFSLLHYKNTKSLTVHADVLETALQSMQNLQHLHVYMQTSVHFLGKDASKFDELEHMKRILHAYPVSLTHLELSLDARYSISDVICFLPPTILALNFRRHSKNTTPVSCNYITLDGAKLLPPHLETLGGIDMLAGVIIPNAEVTRLLPKSLTYLSFWSTNTFDCSHLPPNLTSLHIIPYGAVDGHLTDISGLLRLPLRELEFVCDVNTNLSSLPLLHSLTSLDIGFDDRTKWKPIILNFPTSLTSLVINSVSNIHCNVPPSVKNIRKYSNYSVFEQSTSTWTYAGCEYPTYTPPDVLHAIIFTDHCRLVSPMKYGLLKDVLSFKFFTYDGNTREFNFSAFTRCTRLELSANVSVSHLPPSLTYLDALSLDTKLNYPTTLRHLRTYSVISSSTIVSLRELEFLECTISNTMDDDKVLSAIHHVKKVILRADKRRKDDLMPVPHNATYAYYNSH